VTYVYALDHPHGLPLDDLRALVGGKAANIGVMMNELGLPVPPGFVISTEACRDYLAGGWPDGLDEEITEQLRRVEEQVGRRYGDSRDPLLVSVRSGAPVSMPGMMDTVLNLGITDDTVDGLAASSGDPDFAAVCRERLEAMYRDVVGGEVPADPLRQLRSAIEAVFHSWNSDRARSYRSHEGIPEDLGTAVAVQTMVFGNWDDDSATGVIFTRNPATGEAALYGDVLFRAQGEDVVAGTHLTEPITALDERMPEVAAELRRYADALERYHADVCDIEFTIERGRLWMLQNRIGKRSPQAALRVAVEMAEDPDFPLTREQAVERVAHHLADPPMIQGERSDAVAVASGLAASPGLATGAIATSADTAVEMADGGPVILVRRETSPNDVHGMAAAVGILTSSGGLTSHAAVVARGWGKPAVVGAADVEVGDGSVTIGATVLGAGEPITIDGGTGEVFLGDVGGTPQLMPEAATLLAWAGELGISIDMKEERSTTVTDVVGEGDAGTDAAVRVLAIKGFAMPAGLAPALRVTEEAATAVLEQLAGDGLAEAAGPMYKLTEEGKSVAAELMAADREEWGADEALAALDAFLVLDHRMKHIVTAWQMREVDGEQVLNDHTDDEYDAGVLADLAALHSEAADWFGTLTEGLPRLAEYGKRLDVAAGRVAEGDHSFIAAPMADSYHTIWFELHEDLIQLAGRTREEETAAGRA
jgi:pyruvate,orthophosphate dikinase